MGVYAVAMTTDSRSGLGGLAPAGAFDEVVAVWTLIAAPVTLLSGLDCARLALRLLRGTPV
jgi:hypothetical protein